MTGRPATVRAFFFQSSGAGKPLGHRDRPNRASWVFPYLPSHVEIKNLMTLVVRLGAQALVHLSLNVVLGFIWFGHGLLFF